MKQEIKSIIALIGLGKMGLAIAVRLINAGYKVYGFDTNKETRVHAQKNGIEVVESVEELAQFCSIIWLMIPAGSAIDAILEILIARLPEQSVVIDGGNSYYKDSVRRAALLKSANLFFLDCGTSGGIHALDQTSYGLCLMIGGEKLIFERCVPVFQAISALNGYAYIGPSGAGHYSKMIHNGIEYALLQAYGEGFDLLKHGAYELDLAEISKLWCHGSVIRSWILELLSDILARDENLTNISGSVAESGMGAWTVQEAHERKVSVKLIEDALAIRAQSRINGGVYATKLVSLLRHAFGGHPVKEIK